MIVAKKEIALFLIILCVMGGCKQSVSNDSLIEIDVTASYPAKELILQDFMDVEYIPLETNDEFVTQGVVMAIGSKYIIIKNWTREGDIYVFDRKTGKAIRKINKLGKGPEEYSHLTDIVLDEQKNELFINCLISKKILVYDLLGNFKRSFNHAEDTRYTDVFNYDTDNLICYNELMVYKDGQNRGNDSFHMIVSKQDGSVTRNVSIPFDAIKTPFIVGEGGKTVSSFVSPIIPYQNTWLLVETSSDTVYNNIPKEDKLIPFLVKSPTANPVIFLTMGTITDRYCFMRTVKKEFDFTTQRGFMNNDLMYDKQENAVFKPAIFNGDYVKKQTVDMTSHPVNGDEIAAFQNLQAFKLVEAYKKDELTGKLKEIAAELDEESNPVIMLMKEK